MIQIIVVIENSIVLILTHLVYHHQVYWTGLHWVLVDQSEYWEESD